MKDNERLVALRRRLHACPELGDDLPQTTAIVVEELEKLGCAPRQICPGGLVADIVGEQPGKTMLLRADMDALPMREESGLPFAATGNAAHTCGHDLHTTMLLGAAAQLMENRHRLRGTVRLMFQPAEETATGAAAMLAAGVLEGPKPDAALGLHVEPGQPVGVFNCFGGYKMASFDNFTLTVEGMGGHGAMPDKAVDPIAAAVQLHQSLQTVISRECPPAAACVLTIGSFHAGTAGNILPARAVLQGTARADSLPLRDFLMGRVADYTRAVAAAHRATGSCRITASLPPLYNDETLAPVIAGLISDIVGPDRLDPKPAYKPVSEDFALIAQQIPAVYLTVGTGTAADGHPHGNHHPAVTYSEDVLPLGAAVYAGCALGWLAQQAE